MKILFPLLSRLTGKRYNFLAFIYEIFPRQGKIYFGEPLGGKKFSWKPRFKMCDTNLKKNWSALLYLNISGLDTLILCLVGLHHLLEVTSLSSTFINRIQDGLFRGCSQIGGAKRSLLPKICHTYPTMMKLGTVVPYLKKIKKYMNHVTYPLSSADISIFYRKSPYLAISKNTVIDCILIHNF